jgi:hypothetical protein
MELTIYSYGYIDAMYYVLNGIAMIANSKFGAELVTIMALVSTFYYALRMAYNGHMCRSEMAKIAAMIGLIMGFIIPTCDMLIYDNVSKKREKVDNLPLGFALPIGLLESFGEALTGGFEQAFTTVSNIPYREYGMVFGSRLVQESRNWRINSPEFVENMARFMDRCVMIEAQIGYYYTPQDLLKTSNIWQLIKTSPGELRQVAMRVNKERKLMTCKEARTTVIEPAFRLEVESLNKKYHKTDYGEAGSKSFVQRSFERINSNFTKNVELSFKNYLGITESAEDIIRQRLLINAIRDYADEYGYMRASIQQESNWKVAGDLANTYLPILLAVMKGLVYSSFLFIIPLMMLSGGYGKYLKYLTLVASLQLWAPLNAVLNMFIDLYSSNSLSGIADQIVSFSTASKIGNYTDKIVAIASGLQMVIPYLAFNIVQGGVGGFMHLAGTITGATQAAASQAASEIATNNRSFDNYSSGNQQLYNQGGFKTDWNQSYAAGASSYQHMDGTMEKVTGIGNSLMQSGVGLTASSGATSYRMDEARQAQVTQGLQTAESIHEQDVASLSNAKSNTFSRVGDYVAHIAEREHVGETFNYESMGEQGKVLQQAVNHAKQLHEKNGYSWGQSGQASVEGSVGMSTPFKQILGAGGAVNARGTLQVTNNSDQFVGEDSNVGMENNTNASFNNLVKAASNENWSKENSIDKSYSENVRNSYDDQVRLERAESISKQKVEDWHKAKSVVDSKGASASKDMYQEVVDGIKKQYGVDGKTAQKMADSHAPEAQAVWANLQRQDNYVQGVLNNVHQGQAKVSGQEATERVDQFSETHSDKINKDSQEGIEIYAQNQGVNVNEIGNKVHSQEKKLKNAQQNITAENANSYQEVKAKNEAKATEINKEVQKYEEDRIGQGGTSKILGVATKILSLGTHDARIGGKPRVIDSDSNAEGMQKASNSIKKDDK